MTATIILKEIKHLPDNERAKLLGRLAHEKKLMQEMEELEDVAVFDERSKEPGGIPLENVLQKLKLTK